MFHRPGWLVVGLITAVAAWRLNVSKGRQVDINNGFERLGCRAALEAIGDCCEPVSVYDRRFAIFMAFRELVAR